MKSRLALCLVIVAFVSGCGRQFEAALEKGKDRNGPGPIVVGKERMAKPNFLKAKSWDGVLRGRVIYRGPPPATRELWRDYAECCEGATDSDVKRFSKVFLIDKDGGLAEAVFYLRTGEDEPYLPTPEKSRVREDEIAFSAPYCVIMPRVAIHFRGYRNQKGIIEPTGQRLVIDNSSRILHLIQLFDSVYRPESHLPSPRRYLIENVQGFGRSLPIVCSIHPWMRANVVVLDHPFGAITDEKGCFEISELPTGVPVRLAAEHLHFGALWSDGKQEREMTFQPGVNEIEVIVERGE